jgi:hypothetical protein
VKKLLFVMVLIAAGAGFCFSQEKKFNFEAGGTFWTAIPTSDELLKDSGWKRHNTLAAA